MSKEYIIINDDNSVSIAEINTGTNLEPDQQDDILSISIALEGDGFFPKFMEEIGKLGDLSNLDLNDYINLLTIYRKL